MTPVVRGIRGTNSPAAARRVMERFGVEALPVICRGRLAGMITRGDLARRLGPRWGEEGRVSVASVMSTPLISCYEDQIVQEAAAIMQEERLHRLPVFAGHRRCVGMLTLRDLAAQPSTHRLAEEVRSVLGDFTIKT